MNEPVKERLYNLLPAIYRIRDAKNGEALRALLAVIEQELQNVEMDIEDLYENWFIETCDEWVVPYIGDQLGVRNLHPLNVSGAPGSAFSLRAYVANTLKYRRRKGTATVLEQLARDITGWPARAVEFFQLLAVTQNMNHVRLTATATPDLRDSSELELLGSPFERTTHTADVRRIDGTRDMGRYNIPNIGIFLWRLQSYPIVCSTALAVADPSDGRRYTFSPIGNDIPLFNSPQTEEKITHLAEEINVPGRLRRLPLYKELEKLRMDQVRRKEASPVYFGTNPVFEVFFNDDKQPLPPEKIIICDLNGWDSETWQLPANRKIYDGTELDLEVAVDPSLGRLAVLRSVDLPSEVRVSYSYGFGGDIGGGPYDRRLVPDPGEALLQSFPDTVDNPDVFGKLIRVQYNGNSDLIKNALDEWKDSAANAVIQIEDNCTYREDLEIDMNAADVLTIQAANEKRPTLIGNLRVTGGSGKEKLTINGLLIAGNIRVEGDIRELNIIHCTLVPDQTSVIVEEGHTFLRVWINHSITGSLYLPEEISGLKVQESIIQAPPNDGGSGNELPAIAANGEGDAGPPSILEKTTIFGKVHIKELTLASDVIFNDGVQVENRQTGCVRFSYVPHEQQNVLNTPYRYRCQPDLALARAKELKKNATEDLTEPEKSQIRAYMKPIFTSTRYGDPGFSQLARTCALEIRTGAEDEAEMGAFNKLKQPQRESNLRSALDEYLRLGLKAGIFYIN